MSYTSCGLRCTNEALQRELEDVEEDYFSVPITQESSDESDESSASDSDEHSVETYSLDDDESSQDSTESESEVSFDEEFSQQDARAFLEMKCGCRYGQNRASCSGMFSQADVVEIRCQCAELTSEQLDMLVLGCLDSHTKEGDKRHKSLYYIKDRQVCRKTFMFLRGIGKKRLNNLKLHLKNNGLTPRVHGNTKSTPHNRTPYDTIQEIVTFIKNFAEREGLALPGRVPGFKNSDLKLLPSSTSKAQLWRKYKEAAITMGSDFVAYTKFVVTWNSLLPYIKIQQPSTDLCHTCQKSRSKIASSANLPDEQNIEMLNNYQDHINKHRAERAFYNSAVDDSKVLVAQNPGLSLIHPNRACSLEGTVHYSFDYAQQLQYPANPQQPGPIYFKAPRKCGVFGICCESLPRQINYLIDESVATGKGANATISYLHDFFECHGAGESSVHLHADNCGGQNKNNYVLWYLAWRTINGLHNDILYSFLIAGHTKFSPDWCFGIMKKKMRRTFISSLFDIMEATDNSSVTSINTGKLVGLHDGTVLVKTYQWDAHLSEYFNKLKGISKLHHFRFSKDNPGKLYYREFFDSAEREFQILKDINHLPPLVPLPQQVIPGGLSAERKQYLFREIREFCRPGSEHLVAPE